MYLLPCRYSFPCADTYNNLSLISSQHSLHLYEPVKLPGDCLTGEAASFKDIPFDEDWGRKVVIMPTPGLYGYSKHFSPSLLPSKRKNNLRVSIFEDEFQSEKPTSNSIIAKSQKPSHVSHPAFNRQSSESSNSFVDTNSENWALPNTIDLFISTGNLYPQNTHANTSSILSKYSVHRRNTSMNVIDTGNQ